MERHGSSNHWLAVAALIIILLGRAVAADKNQYSYTTAKALQYWRHHAGHLHEDSARRSSYDEQAINCLALIDEPGEAMSKQKSLAIVVSASDGRRDDIELQHTSGAWATYAKHNNYTFQMVWLPETGSPETGSLHFFTRRWAGILASSVWKEHQWVLGIDGDTIPRALNISFDPFLASSQDIILHARLNGEVEASAVMMKTSPFAECFLRTWVSKGYYTDTIGNWDNGDLLQTVLDFAHPSHARACHRIRALAARTKGKAHIYEDFIKCFSELHAELLVLHQYMPIKVFAPFANGFLRVQDGMSIMNKSDSELTRGEAMYRACWPHEVIIHGYKRLGQDVWNAEEGRAVCKEVSAEKRLEVANTCCLVHYPGCHQDRRVNVCQLNCPTTAGWISIDGC